MASMAEKFARDKIAIGRARIKMAQARAPEAPLFMRPSNEEMLDIAREGAGNLMQGTMELNKILKKNQQTDASN